MQKVELANLGTVHKRNTLFQDVPIEQRVKLFVGGNHAQSFAGYAELLASDAVSQASTAQQAKHCASQHIASSLFLQQIF